LSGTTIAEVSFANFTNSFALFAVKVYRKERKDIAKSAKKRPSSLFLTSRCFILEG